MEQNKSDQIIVYSTVWCPDCKRAKKFFGEQRVPYVNIDIEQDAEAMAFVEKVNDGKHIIPTIFSPTVRCSLNPRTPSLRQNWACRRRPAAVFTTPSSSAAAPPDSQRRCTWRVKE
jgi:glutaredoxin